MKSIFKLISIIILLTSCDETFDYNFIVDNQTDSQISVIYTTGNEIQNYTETIYVKPYSDSLFFIEHAAGGRELRGVDINIVFEKFIIKKDTLTSKKNYRVNESWEFSERSDNIGQYLLLVKSSDF